MRIKLGSGLLPLNLLVLLLITTIFFFPYDALRIAVGIPFVLFFPGYALMAALYIRKVGMGGIERVALSLGMSLAVVVLIGLILNYTPWGITLDSVLYSLASFILAMSIIAWVRRKRLTEWDRFNIEFKFRLLGWGGSVRDKVLSAVLVIAILGAFGMLGYVIAMPKTGEKFTEFYILGEEGKAADYPEELGVGQEGRVILGIINNEYETMDYRVEVRIDGVINNEIGPVVLEHDEKWEEEVSFIPQIAGGKQEVEFLLYKNGQSEPCFEPLRLWINVTE